MQFYNKPRILSSKSIYLLGFRFVFAFLLLLLFCFLKFTESPSLEKKEYVLKKAFKSVRALSSRTTALLRAAGNVGTAASSQDCLGVIKADGHLTSLCARSQVKLQTCVGLCRFLCNSELDLNLVQ